MSNYCQGCGEDYMTDFIVPDALWEEIKPVDVKADAGLLCGRCIAKSLETLAGYESFVIIKTEDLLELRELGLELGRRLKKIARIAQ